MENTLACGQCYHMLLGVADLKLGSLLSKKLGLAHRPSMSVWSGKGQGRGPPFRSPQMPRWAVCLIPFHS